MIRRNRFDSNIAERICFIRVHCGSKKLSLCLPADDKTEEKDNSKDSSSSKSTTVSNIKPDVHKIKEQFVSNLNDIISKNLNVLVNTYNMKKKKKSRKNV